MIKYVFGRNFIHILKGSMYSMYIHRKTENSTLERDNDPRDQNQMSVTDLEMARTKLSLGYFLNEEQFCFLV